MNPDSLDFKICHFRTTRSNSVMQSLCKHRPQRVQFAGQRFALVKQTAKGRQRKDPGYLYNTVPELIRLVQSMVALHFLGIS